MELYDLHNQFMAAAFGWQEAVGIMDRIFENCREKFWTIVTVGGFISRRTSATACETSGRA